jgi:3-hydroxyisobutyrate dehydrogenase-like beta-hydroxyacid dehydrogenase
MTTVAVVGLGEMGGRVARRLLAAGHEVVGWNRSAERTARLEQDGGRAAASPAEAARWAEVVITMVADPPALAAVTEGPDGVAAGASRSTTVIEMSTVGPAGVSRLASALPAEAGLLDAPVLGSLTEAEAGSLHVFVGGPPALAERWTSLFETLGSPLHVGPLGSGAAAKLVANAVLFGVLGALGEAVALGEGLRLSRDAVFDVLAATPLAAQAERRRPAIESGEYPPRFPLRLARKDADLVAEAAAAAGIDLRLAPAARTWLAEAAEAGWNEQDYSATLGWIVGDSR